MQPKYLWKYIQNYPSKMISAGYCAGLGSPQDRYLVYRGKKNCLRFKQLSLEVTGMLQ